MQAQTRRVRPAVFLATVGIVILVMLLIAPVRQWMVTVVTGGARPLAQLSLSTAERFNWPTSLRQSSPSENQLQAELAATAQQLAKARQELQARQTGDELAEYLQQAAVPTKAASVIGYSPDPGVQSFVINIGRRDGLGPNQAVITGDGWLVGKTVTVHETTTVVLLLTDAQSLVLASVQNSTLSQGVVRGERGLTIRMDLIPKNDSIVIGQSVVTSGLEEGIPPDLLIGTVSAIEQRSGEVFQRARITIPIRYGRVRQVAVVTK